MIGPDGVTPSLIVGVSASDISPCTMKSRRSFLLEAFFWHQLTRIVPEKWP